MTAKVEPLRPTPAGSVPVFTRKERWEVASIYAGILVATLLGFAAIFVVGRTYGILIGLGVLAYTLGLRHGVDADHICAIDTTTRKLLQQGKRPHTVGTWFSLGHSTIVMAMLVAFVVAARWVISNFPSFESGGKIVGTAVSGGFLYVIAFINLLIFLEIYSIFRRLRSGALDHRALEEQLDRRGFMNRYFNFLFRLVNEPWQIYPIGVLFGLGFDTATEVTLIAITVTVGTAATAFPLWMILVLPFMFTCGMVLTDTSDGIGMRFAYGWAFLKPIRKVYYNLTMTVISVLVAFVVGTIEILGVVASELGLSGGPFGFWKYMNWLNAGVGPGSLDVWGYVGIGIVALFVGCWLVAMAIYRWKRYEEIGFGPSTAPVPVSPS
ncbi:MAG: HoxN/HupN/NixA family nickel/cobalt transporter [Thermoplasmata archaeon]|nr:HoxN/HupN/NixA family nickel/cobalt transporter [Thermoplasmata archaeon]MCI4359216.1 HoxN/HupN/NixA family nickel/cobalt transporter [Thermoplasmata archaeon]